ncbi:MAG TPA: hypothetical protein VF206_07880, partial [Rubrobacter sp.]
ATCGVWSQRWIMGRSALRSLRNPILFGSNATSALRMSEAQAFQPVSTSAFQLFLAEVLTS